MRPTTRGVVTRGLLPPMAPGSTEPPTKEKSNDDQGMARQRLFNCTCFVVASENLAHASVRDFQSPADVTRTNAKVGHLNDSQTNRSGQGSAIDKDAAELIHFAVALT